MARQKKDSVNEEIEILNEDEMELSEANEEAEEMELSEESSEDEQAKPAKRKSRSKKREPEGLAAQFLKSSSEGKPEPTLPKFKKDAVTLETSDDAEKEFEAGAADAFAEETTEADVEAPKKARRPRSSPEEKSLSVAMEAALEAMTSHWTKAKEATDALVANLERVKKDLEEVKDSSAAPLQRIIDQSKEKQAVASRVTFALSLGAIIFSFVSLTLSQSVRGQLLGLTQSPPQATRYQAATPSAPVAPATSSLIPSAPVNGDAAKSLAKVPGPRRVKSRH